MHSFAAKAKAEPASSKTARPLIRDSRVGAILRGTPVRIQPKLTVGATDDPLEHEADRIADRVMRMPAPCGQTAGAPDAPAMPVRRAAATDGGLASGIAAPPVVHDVLRSQGQSLDTRARTFLEPRFGRDFSDVRVHTDGRAEESAASVGARAYTFGNHLAFGKGQYAPHTQDGQRLLAHELTHVVQQQNVIARKADDKDKLDILAITTFPWTGKITRNGIGFHKHPAPAKGDMTDYIRPDFSADDRVTIKAKSPRNWLLAERQHKGRAQTGYVDWRHVDYVAPTKPAVAKSDVPKSSMPFIEQADPAEGLNTIGQLVALMQAFETAFPQVKGDTRKEITLLRKVYYGQEGWDKHLIRGEAANTPPPFALTENVSERAFKSDEYGDASMRDNTYTIDPANDKTATLDGRAVLLGHALQKAQEVTLPDGSVTDVGHILAGLDAANNPASVDLQSAVPSWFLDVHGLLEIRKNMDATTWIGDLGSVVAEAVVAHLQHGSDKLTDVIRKLAPARDLLGNIDAYVLADRRTQAELGFNTLQTSGGKPVSAILADFYGDKGAKVRSKRYTTFADAIGVLRADGKVHALQYIAQVRHAAALYVGAAKGPMGLIVDLGFGSQLQPAYAGNAAGSDNPELQQKQQRKVQLNIIYETLTLVVLRQFEGELQHRVDSEKKD
jgi:hypothetical protein